MLFRNIGVYLTAGACLAVAPVLGAKDINQAVSDMNALTAAVQNARQSIDNYQGGTLSGLQVKSSVQTAKDTSQTARQNLAQQDEPFTDDEAEQYYQAYQALCPELLGAIQSTKDKAPQFKASGHASQAQTTIDSLSDEHNNFRQEAQKHVPADTYDKASSCSDQISQGFDDTHNALS
ncbi:hypothetical protein AbraIFM66951_003685 [Aspergillus brasiliensis]|uniref:Uncharacterized protein n=1 Tax=Aspergillus brasiliensis TaxID=319629 RepID=A0A9W5YP19_9EURO|nr:hypothetical protein AbraCBS73388_004596 [Aspergillus brasiliensis]GKZ43131.1 hypothetical protein AbraIFM66951_003685 [Aspergillus brasiliensis]